MAPLSKLIQTLCDSDIDANLSCSYEQRVVHHQEALDLVLALEKAGYQVDERWVVRKLWELRGKRAKP